MGDPRVLFYDLETAPNLVTTWGTWEQNALDVVRPWSIMCAAWMFEGDRAPQVLAVPDTKQGRKDPDDDSGIVERLHGLFDEADVVVAHNGDRFDQRKARARMVIHGMDPPSPFLTVDTLKVARREFAFNSNRLDDLGEVLGCGRKVRTGGYSLWRDCLAGDEAAWSRMRRYNRGDVRLLREVYLRLRPWMSTGHPNLATVAGVPDGCPKCGHEDLMRRGLKFTATGTFQSWQCQGCGGYSRSRRAEQSVRPERV